MKVTHGYDPVDLFFDLIFVFEGDDTPVPNDKDQPFMKEIKNKNALNENLAKKLIELHNGAQLLVATLEDTVISSFDSEPLEHSDISENQTSENVSRKKLIKESFAMFFISLIIMMNSNG